MTLGELIKEYLQNNTMTDFSKESGLSRAYAYMLIKNKNNDGGEIVPSIETVKKVARGIHMPFDEVIARLDEDITVGIHPERNPAPPALSPEESALLEDYRVLNDTGQQEATKRVHELTLIPSYVEVRFLGHQKEDNDIIPLAAHHAPGVTGAEDEAVDEVERLRRKYEKED